MINQYKAEQGWIQNAELIPEYNTYKVDGSSRIIIPAYLKKKLNMDIGDYADYYTAYINGKWFLCVCCSETKEGVDDEE